MWCATIYQGTGITGRGDHHLIGVITTLLSSHGGVGGRSKISGIFCPPGYSHFISACVNISSSLPELSYPAGQAACASEGDQPLIIRDFFLYQGVKAFISDVANTSSFWVGSWSGVEGSGVAVEDIPGEGECVVASRDNQYSLARVSCTSQAIQLCEARQPACPGGYEWVPGGDGDMSCYKISDHTETKDTQGKLFSSISTAHKICQEDGTRLGTPTTPQQRAAIATFLKTNTERVTGVRGDTSRVWLGLQYFPQSKTVPQSCPACSSSPDWADVFISPHTKEYITKEAGQALLGHVFSESHPCYTLDSDNNVQASFCMEEVAADKKVRALCEYRGCYTDTAACVFPFLYGGRQYSSCTTVGGDGTAWCSTQVDSHGQHVEGSTMACPAHCAVSDCPVGFTRHLTTCTQESPSTREDSHHTIDQAEARCTSQGARLLQPRSTRSILARKTRLPIFYDNSVPTVAKTIHGWAVSSGLGQETAIGLVVRSPDSRWSLGYRDGSEVPSGLVTWLPGYPSTHPDNTCITLQEGDKITNNNCQGFSNNTGPFLSYVCEALPLTTIAGDAPHKACHLPFRLEPGGELLHSCVYGQKKDGSKDVWCPTKVDDDGVVVKGETGECEDERNTVYDGPGRLLFLLSNNYHICGRCWQYL